MASVTDHRPADSGTLDIDPAQGRFVDAQIHRTRRALKIVDLTAGLITLTIGVLGYLLAFAVIEHWIIPGGWGPIGRSVLFAVLFGGIAWYCWRHFWPLLSKPINPAYAAKAIEQSSPSLKNSLLNFLLLRQRRLQISRQVYQAIEQQAAQRLAQVPLDSVVDRSSILKLGYVLVGVVALCALYRVLSPKDPLASAGRVLMPWSEIAVPSRVQITDVKPGDTSAARGEQLVVTAEVLGAGADEPVRLRYSANDQQVVDQEVLMTPQEGGLRFEGRLPGRVAMGSGAGIQSDLTYWIDAGDAHSPHYKVTVFSQPTLVVEKIRYEYPIYTRYVPREVENTGDLSGVEGTIVTITAVANQPIETAHVDFEADGRHDLLMKSEGTKATVSFPLELSSDRRTPRYSSYVLRYTTAEGRKNPSPPKYSIDVEQDYAPEIELIAPKEETLNMGLQEEVTIEVEARDPDFAVHNVAILGEVAGERVLKKSLLSLDHTGRFTGKLKIVPQDLNLKPGDVLEYWGAAADNRRPEPNLAFTKHQKLKIIGRPDLGGGQQQGEQGEQQGNQGEGQGGENGEQGEGGQAGGSGEGGQQGESQDQQGGQRGQGGEGGEGQQSESAGGDGQQQSGADGQAGDVQNESQSDSQAKAGGESPSQGNEDSAGQHNDQPGSQESGAKSSGGQLSGGEGKVSPEGDDDATAFERINQHFEEKEGQQGDSKDSQGEESNDGEGDSQQSGEAGNQSGSEKSAKPSEGGDNAQSQGEEQSEQQSDQQGSKDGQQQSDQQGDEQGQQEGAQQDKQQGEQSGEKNGAEGNKSSPQEGGEKGDQQGEKNDTGGEMQENQGPAGAGDNPGENEGAPNPAGDMKPNDKPTKESGDAKQNDQEAPMEGQQKRESDSQGAEGGDRTGGGQEGGGQKADEKGTGGAGEHQAADEGGSQSNEQGQGETGDKAGGDQKAPGETGESSGEQPGQGGEQGDTAGQKPGGDQPQQGEQEPNGNPSDPGTAGGPPQGGGTGGSSSAPPSQSEIEAGDEANLDYSRKQTDLVLDKLEDQLRKQQVDQELLDKLGWTPDELRHFVERWKHLKSLAEGQGPQADKAQLELNDALRSLGLGSKSGPRFQSKNAKDKLRDLQDAYHGRTPMEYQERMRKYVKGTATAQEQ